MPRIKVRVRTGYGDLEVSGDSPEDVMEGLGWLTADFIASISERVGEVDAAEDILKGVVMLGRDGPTIVTRDELSHYECIGLVMYAMRNKEATGREIRDRLTSSGKRITVPARLHEMSRKGHVFQTGGKGSRYRLTMKGISWVESEVLPRLGRG